jgi:N-acetylmuramoyl-L-alanine amidase
LKVKDTPEKADNSMRKVAMKNKNLYTALVRMRKFQFLAGLWMALMMVGTAQARLAAFRVATVNYTHHGNVVRGYRVGDEFLLPVNKLDSIDWNVKMDGSTARITAENTKIAIISRTCNGESCVPLREALYRIGGMSNWIPGGYDALEAVSPIKSIVAKGGILMLDTALNVQPKVSLLTNPTRVMIDLDGARLSKSAVVTTDALSKVEPYGSRVRIVMQLGAFPNSSYQNLKPSNKLKFDFNLPTKQDPIPIIPIPTQQTVEIQPAFLTVVNDTKKVTELAVRVQPGLLRSNPTYRSPEKNVIEIVLPGIIAELSRDTKLEVDRVKNFASYAENGSTIIRLELDRPLGIIVDSISNGADIKLMQPLGDGSLAGKLIVIDPGHGGSDSGATAGGLKEKDLAFKISKYVREVLIAEGMTVLMTRSGDTKPSFDDRAALANMNNASAFISIHINSPGRGSQSASGTGTYYHFASKEGKMLARLIHDDIISSGLLPNRGIVSDGVRFPGEGYAVLRKSKVPAVMIECGFITNAKDRQVMQTDEFARAIANGIINGLKIYYGQQ